MRSLLEVDQSRHLWSYIQIARVDHWFKNVFMLLGVLLAFFYEPALFTWTGILQVGYALFATCLIASSNYVLNELLDAPSDRFHPVKKYRPVPIGKMRPTLACTRMAPPRHQRCRYRVPDQRSLPGRCACALGDGRRV